SDTGKIWMDRNLGASQVATSSNDADAYGDLYQWGRAADGHESRTSSKTATLATSDTPGHGDFITNGSSPADWRSSQNDNLWQGVSGTNNPCPSGYRLPTEAEWENELTSWDSNNSAGAFASPLKLPVAGYRYRSDGSLNNVGSSGYYWSSTVSGTNASYLYFVGSNAYMYSLYRASGFSVRCLKD
ncbi:FISUMP domain-containing protein, partial [Flavivirga aquimarina]